MWQFVLKVAVSIVLLWLPLRHVSIRVLLADASGVDVRTAAVVLMIVCSSTLVAAARWSVILRALRFPRRLGQTYPMTLIGLFFSQALPAGLGGDAVRIWLGSRTGLPLRIAVASIVGDRLAGLVAILVIVGVQVQRVRTLDSNAAFFASLCSALVVGFAVFVIMLQLDRWPSGWLRFPLVREVATLSGTLRTSLLSPAGSLIFACSIGIQCCNIGAVFVLALGLHLTVPLGAALLVVPLATVLQTLPISIAGWGVRESFFVFAFGVVGIAEPQSLTLSVLLGLLTIVSSLPGGVLWLRLDARALPVPAKGGLAGTLDSATADEVLVR